MNIEGIIDLPNSSDVYVRQSPDSKIEVFALINGSIKKYASDINTGTWKELKFVEEEFNLAEKDIKALAGDFIEDLDIMLLQKNNEIRAIARPDETGTYSNSSPYRLFWAYDTKKLYINMADQWVFCGTLVHDLLDGVGKYSHEFIDEFIDAGGDPGKLKELWDAIKSLDDKVTVIESELIDAYERLEARVAALESRMLINNVDLEKF